MYDQCTINVWGAIGGVNVCVCRVEAPARVSLERSVSELSLDWLDWADSMQYGGVCVGGGPVDPLRTVFERAVSVGGVGGRARGSVERSLERTRV